MASAGRRLQIKLLKKKGVKPVMILCPKRFKAVGMRWPFNSEQIAFLPDGTRIMPGDKIPVLQPILDVLSEAA